MPNQQRLKQARQLVTKWRRLLGIEKPWTVRVEVPDVAEDAAKEGDVDLNDSGYYKAVINIMPATIMLPERAWQRSIEPLIVHEMLHVLMTDYDRFAEIWCGAGEDKDDGKQSIVEYHREQLVTRLERVLVRLAKGAT